MVLLVLRLRVLVQQLLLRLTLPLLLLLHRYTKKTVRHLNSEHVGGRKWIGRSVLAGCTA
jgi:hypothetical protein